MFTPSAFSSRIVAAWIPAYLVLAVHGVIVSTAAEFSDVFVFYPLLCGIPLGLFSYFYPDENEELFEQVGIPDTEQTTAIFAAFIVMPLGFVALAMLAAQRQGSYSDVAWIVIIFGGLILGEMGKQLKFKSWHKDN